jgi:DNA-directed RNA polymerase specialized sigma24 family protein
VKVGFTMNLKLQLREAAPVWNGSADRSMSFYVRASRYRGLLHFVVYRVLGNPERADIAVENCLFSASHRVTAFDCEGAFRSWLVRIAIDQALAILHGRSIREHRRDWSLQEQDNVALIAMKCNSRFSSVAPAVEAIARVDLSALTDRPKVATPSQILTIIGMLESYPPALRPASNSVDGNTTKEKS